MHMISFDGVMGGGLWIRLWGGTCVCFSYHASFLMYFTLYRVMQAGGEVGS